MRKHGVFSWIIGVLLPLMFGVVAARADSLTIILDRSTNSSELYVAGPAETLLALFDVDRAVIPMQDGVVDYSAFALGTWGIGDALLQNTRVTFDNAPSGFEAMSFMLHPSEDALPLQTPFDANMAIGICSALSSPERYALEEMTGYVGYFSDQTSSASTIEVVLPSVSRTSLNISGVDYMQGGALTFVRRFEPGEPIRFVIPPPGNSFRLNIPLVLLALVSVFAAAWKINHRSFVEHCLRQLFAKHHGRKAQPTSCSE